MRPRRPAAFRSVLSLTFAAALAAPAALLAQTPADGRVCERAAAPARYPEVRPRLQAQAAAGGAGAAFAQGCLHLAADRFEPAVQSFAQAVAANDASPAAHFYLGRAYAEQAQRVSMFKAAPLARKVKAEFERAVQLAPDYLDARQGLMQFYLQAPGIMGGSADKAREQAYEIRKRDPYRGAFVYAQLAARNKDLGGAAREYDQLTRTYPDSAEPYAFLAATQLALKNPAAAWAAADRLERRAPNTPWALYLPGRLAAETGDQLDRGAQALGRYLERPHAPSDPAPATAHWRLGAIHERQGRRDLARAQYEAALKADASYKPAREALAKLR